MRFWKTFWGGLGEPMADMLELNRMNGRFEREREGEGEGNI